jgi:radical SAM/Cys-rich protein
MSRELPVVDTRSARVESAVPFERILADHDLELRAAAVEVLQINVGKVCNQACKHCHVDAGPARTESMPREIAVQCIDAVRRSGIRTVDITGGAPELNPSFRWLVAEARALGAHVIVRHNLTVMFEAGQEDLPEFFRDHSVEVVSSLPCYLEENVDRQRGKGVYDKSIEALKRLNAVGYGVDGSGLVLNLVYNPVGPHLPPPQEALETDYKRELAARFGVTFNRLYTITNLPVRRFLDDLRRSGNEASYMRKLVDAFNPRTVDGLMCRTQLSVDWTGGLHDCDFNQMLEMGVERSLARTIGEFSAGAFADRRILTGSHCFGCTAGAGSSCGGAVV